MFTVFQYLWLFNTTLVKVTEAAFVFMPWVLRTIELSGEKSSGGIEGPKPKEPYAQIHL